jgi:hypothetical protein
MSKKMMDDMEAMAKKYNPFKVRLGQVQTDSVTPRARLDDDRPVVPSFVGVGSENADIVSRDVARLRSPPHVALPRDRHASRTRQNTKCPR